MAPSGTLAQVMRSPALPAVRFQAKVSGPPSFSEVTLDKLKCPGGRLKRPGWCTWLTPRIARKNCAQPHPTAATEATRASPDATAEAASMATQERASRSAETLAADSALLSLARSQKVQQRWGQSQPQAVHNSRHRACLPPPAFQKDDTLLSYRQS